MLSFVRSILFLTILLFGFYANSAFFCHPLLKRSTTKTSSSVQKPLIDQLKTGQIDTFAAYSYEENGKVVWTNERSNVHADILQRFREQIAQAHRVLISSPFVKQQNQAQPLLILTRGNSGAGKTYAIKYSKHPLINSLKLSAIANDHELGIINPDSIKSILQSEVHQGEVSSGAVHEEGSYLAKILIAEALDHGRSIIIDKRFTTLQSLESALGMAKKNGYRVVMVDVDAPLRDSSFRIVGRPIGDNSPNVPFGAVLSGFVETRVHRQEIARAAEIDDYILLTGKDIVAYKSPDKGFVVKDQQRWSELTRNNEQDIEKSEALYKDILNSLSQVTVKDVLKPFVNEVVKPMLELNINDYGTLMQLRDLHYLMQKGEGLEHHEKFSRVLAQYIKRKFTEVTFTQTVNPGSENRMPSIKIAFQTKQKEHANILLLNSTLNFTLVRSDESRHIVELDTRKISLVRPDQILIRQEDPRKYAIGGSTQKSGGMVAYEFIKNSVALKIDAVKLFNIFVKPKGVKIRFHRDRDFINFRYGFSTVEIQANLFAAQVEHYLFQTSPEAEKKHHQESAKDYLLATKEFLSVFELARSSAGVGFSIESTVNYTESELSEWLSSLKQTISSLDSELN